MLTATEICNRALDKLGAEPIFSITNPTLVREKFFARVYPMTKRREIKRHRWVCAKRETYLSPLTERTARGLYRFPLPTDCLRPLRDDNTTWVAAGKQVHDIGPGPLLLDYIADISEGEFDDLLVEVIACKLAQEAAWSVTQNRNVEQDRAAEYREALMTAKRDNAFVVGDEDLSDSDRGHSWVTERF